MMVLGADTHKRSHTIAAVAAVTGELRGEKTVAVGARGFAALVVWARGLDGERVWALEDCRHVAGSFERFLIARGERVLRVPTKLMADSRRAARTRGKSDSIDAGAVARAALREGLNTLPAAHLDGPELDVRLLVDHRERLVRHRVGLNNTLQWHLHDLWPELELPGGALFSAKWCTRIGRRLARAEQTTRVRIARDELRRLRELTQSVRALEAEIAQLVARIAPQLLSERVRAADRGQAGRRNRRRWPLRFGCQACPGRWSGSDPGQLGQDQPPPPRPRRQPPDQRGHPSHRRDASALPSRDPRLHRPQALRRQDQPRRRPLPQAPPRPPHLATPATARAPHGPDDHTHFIDIGAARAIAAAQGLAAAGGRRKRH